MAEIEVMQVVSESFSVQVVAGKKLRIQILNANDTEDTLVYLGEVPTAKKLEGSVALSGRLRTVQA